MRPTKVVESVDIDAPCEELFEIVANCDRRPQLSPLWGATEIQEITADFPAEGSRYRVLLSGEEQEVYDTIVTAYAPPHKFAYRLTAHRQPQATWTLQEANQGTRLIYHEEFLVDESGDEEFVQGVRNTAQQWLTNIKDYAELREGRIQLFTRWLLDRYLLKMPPEQRHVILLIVAFKMALGGSLVLLAFAFALMTLF